MAAHIRHPLLVAIDEVWPADRWTDVSVLVGVSGGADSVALLRALHQLRVECGKEPAGSLLVAHFNHGTRASAEVDAEFVRELAGQLELPFLIGQRADDAPDHDSDAILRGHPNAIPEETLRDARYQFFAKAAEDVGARQLALAHTADDQAETVLHRVIRGTGLRGLSGVPFTRELCHGASIVRPLLTVDRQVVLDYLQSLNQPFQEDPSNTDLGYTRNAIRHDLLPRLEQQFNPRVRTALLRLAQQADDAYAALDELAQLAVEEAVTCETNGTDTATVTIDRQRLAKLPESVARIVFVRIWEQCGWPQQAMGDVQWRRLAALTIQPVANGQRVTETMPGDIRVESSVERLTLSCSRPA